MTTRTFNQIMRNANRYGAEMARTATPEQIARVRQQNELFDRGLEVCRHCKGESLRENDECEFCGKDKLPF